MMKRKKHLVLKALEEAIDVDKRFKVKATLIDDNPLNIKDVERLKDDSFAAIQY